MIRLTHLNPEFCGYYGMLGHTLPDGPCSKYGVTRLMFTLWVMAPFLIHMVPFIETLVIAYGPCQGAAIFCWIPPFSNKTLSPTLYS